ncbi:MAG: TIGR03663 family protein [Acidobacteria bacterium]|nr:TIGR03663 family protein [Acidobacteriota bacterium]
MSERVVVDGSTGASAARRRAWIALILLAVALHLWGLGGRSFHHDESIHARLSWDLLHEGSYRYDPTYHGPLLYMLTAGTFAVLGDSDFTARIPAALAGILMLAVAWKLRRPFGDRAAWWTGLLFTVSPIFLYYGRFLRMDLIEAVTASAAFLALWAAIRGSDRAWPWLGLWAGLAFATKENAYVTVFLAVLAGGMTGLAFGPRQSLARALRWLTAKWTGIATAVSVFIVVTIPLYTVGFTHLADWCFPLKAIAYWWKQHEIARVGGPWWYHLPRLAQYEFLPILLALIWIVRRRKRLKPVEIFLFSFGVLSIGLYCYLGEKTPWLEVHQVWAFIPLAGAQLARTFGRRGRRWSRSLAAIGLAATLVVSFVASFVLDEISPAQRRVESLIFVQTCPEFRDVAMEGLRLARSNPGVVAAVSGEAAWPLMWYWRKTGVMWSLPHPGQRPPLVICDPETEAEARSILGPGYSRRRIPLRAWWLMYQRKPSLEEIARYELTRIPWGSIGSTDVIVLTRMKKTAAVVTNVPVPKRLQEAFGAVSMKMLGTGWLGEPRGISIRSGRIAVADAALSQVMILDPAGTARRVDVGGLNQPESVVWAGANTLLVADTWSQRVVRVNVATGREETLPAPRDGWYGPRGIAIGPDGSVAVTDTGHKRIILYAPDLHHRTVIGHPGTGRGGLIEPVGIAWLDRQSFVVCDTGNRRLEVFTTDGVVRRIVGLPAAWSDFYSRPQIAVLGPRDWIVSDTPGKALWRIRGTTVERIALGRLGMDPTGVAWDAAGHELAIGDLSGKVWVLEVPRG